MFQSLVHNYNAESDSKKNIRLLNNGVKLKVGKSPKTKFLEKEITVEKQVVYDDHTLDLCDKAALNAWDRTGEIGKKIESFTKDIQGPKEIFTDFLQRLTSTVNRMIPNSEARQKDN